MQGGEIPKFEYTLASKGAQMVSTTGKKLVGITVDREVVSGANPMAADALGSKFIAMLSV